jgi:uncharacterized protein (TIGR02001 family)
MINVKPILPIAVALLAAIAQPALAEEAPAAAEQPGSWFPGTFTGTVALNNDYIFRGISQTDHNPAIQGSINYTLDTGFYGTSVYGGVWGSNLDFNDDQANNNHGAHLELDWTFGFTGNILDTGIGYTLGAIYYDYPGARNGLSYNYWEFAPALTYAVNDWLSLNGGLNYSPDYFGGSGEGFYPNGGVTVKIPVPNNWFALSAFGMTGHQWIEHNSKFGTDDYQDWKLGLTVGIKNITLTAAYTDTSLDKHECFGGTNLCGARALLSLGAAF